MRGMLDLPEVHRPIAELLNRQLDEVTVLFERQLASDLSAINGLCMHIELYRGKMLRPTLVLLSGLAARGEPIDGEALNHKHRVVAAVTEMIHMATLVHDDVLDEAQTRRRGSTVNHLWGNETAVMLGDYLISNAFHLCSSIGDPAINLALGEVTNTLCEGELIQLHHRNDFGIDEDTYLEIIRRKTASLIGECCRLGAVLAGAERSIVNALSRYGVAMGMAFQIQDDLLDLIGDETIVGKDLGKDLDKGKLTLPVTHLMASADQTTRGNALELIEQRDIHGLRDLLMGHDSVIYARDKAAAFVVEGRAELAALPASSAAELLHQLAGQVVDRSA